MDERGRREPGMERPRGSGGKDILNAFESYVQTTSSGVSVSYRNRNTRANSIVIRS